MADGGLFRGSGTRTLSPVDEFSNTGASKGWRLTNWDGTEIELKIEYDASGDITFSTKDYPDVLIIKNDGTGISVPTESKLFQNCAVVMVADYAIPVNESRIVAGLDDAGFELTVTGILVDL